MKTKFLSRKFSWRRVGIGVLIGAIIIFIIAGIFLILAQYGLLTPRV
jgi:hypothetical protein